MWPYSPTLAAPLAGLSVYGWCRRVLRPREFDAHDAQDSGAAGFVVSVVGDLIGAAVDAGSSADD